MKTLWNLGNLERNRPTEEKNVEKLIDLYDEDDLYHLHDDNDDDDDDDDVDDGVRVMENAQLDEDTGQERKVADETNDEYEYENEHSTRVEGIKANSIDKDTQNSVNDNNVEENTDEKVDEKSDDNEEQSEIKAAEVIDLEQIPNPAQKENELQEKLPQNGAANADDGGKNDENQEIAAPHEEEKTESKIKNEISQQKDQTITGPVVTEKVFFVFTVNGIEAGRVEVGLFGQIVPKTVANFKSFCQGFNSKSGFVTYKGTRIYRSVKGFILQGGDVGIKKPDGNLEATFNREDTVHVPTDISIYDGTFEDENFVLKHYGAGWVNMANRGPDSNTSHFCFLLDKAEHLDGHFVVFAKVLSGMPVLRYLESLPINDTSPVDNIVFADCGVIDVPTPFAVDYGPSNENI